MFILPYNLYREIWKYCGESDIAPLWKITSTEFKPVVSGNLQRDYYGEAFSQVYGDGRTLIYETEDNSIKIIQNAALYVLALNCGIIAYWFGQYKPIFTDFQTNHGAKNENGERIGRPRTQKILGCPIPERYIGLNRFIIMAQFLSKICIPSISGRSNRNSVHDIRYIIYRI